MSKEHRVGGSDRKTQSDRKSGYNSGRKYSSRDRNSADRTPRREGEEGGRNLDKNTGFKGVGKREYGRADSKFGGKEQYNRSGERGFRRSDEGSFDRRSGGNSRDADKSRYDRRSESRGRTNSEGSFSRLGARNFRDGDKSGRKRSEGEYRNSADRRPRSEGNRDDRSFTERQEAEKDHSLRIAKYLARCGISSRREAEEIILAGRVTIDGRVVNNLATKIMGEERVYLDNKAIAVPQRTRLWIYHKPSGLVTTTRDPEGRPTVFENLPTDLPRVISVGRLDINTEGLLLLTNDGDLSRVLELPTTGWLRRYRVRAFGKIEQKQLDGLKNGSVIDGIFYGPISAIIEKEQGSNIWISMSLREGKNREIKKVLGSLGLEVNRLIRVSFGPFQLGELEKGKIEEIKSAHLRTQLGERLMKELRGNVHLPPLPSNNEEEVEKKDARRGDLRCRSANVWRAKGCCKVPKRKEETDDNKKTFRKKYEDNSRSSQRTQNKHPDRPRDASKQFKGKRKFI